MLIQQDSANDIFPTVRDTSMSVHHIESNQVLISCLKVDSVLPKQLQGKDDTAWFAVAFPVVVRPGIYTLSMVPETARLLHVKDTMGSLTSTN